MDPSCGYIEPNDLPNANGWTVLPPEGIVLDPKDKQPPE